MPERDKMPYETSLPALLTSIVRQAQEDGRISSEESELINRIQVDVRSLEQQIAQSMKDGNKSIAEIFDEMKTEMIRNATETAKADGIITDDEEAIINRLISELETLKE